MAYVFRLGEARGVQLGAPGGPRTMYLLVEPEHTGTNAVAMGVEDFLVEGSTPHHAHPHSDEIFFVISGSGRAVIGDESHEVGPGDAIWIPRGVRHQILNTGPGTLRTTWTFVPAGPEQSLDPAGGAGAGDATGGGRGGSPRGGSTRP
jgi:mannose-6-phosphate isomerase-like protein (cupin superfamily)